MELDEVIALWMVIIAVSLFTSIFIDWLTGLFVAVAIMVGLLTLGTTRKNNGMYYFRASNNSGRWYRCLRCEREINQIPCRFCGGTAGKVIFDQKP